MKPRAKLQTDGWWLWVAAGVVMLALGGVVLTGRATEKHPGVGVAFIAAGALALAFGVVLGILRLQRRRGHRADGQGAGPP